MKIPKIISKNNREYILVKEYDTYVRYADMLTGFNECFHKQELRLVPEVIKPIREFKIRSTTGIRV